MPFYAVDALLLMLFSVPVVLRYKLLPTETTPYWLFGILFMLLISHVFISLYSKGILSEAKLFHLKTGIVSLVLCIVVGGVVLSAIQDRSHGSPTYGVHDIILQQEAAMRYLIQGKNPYKETYFGTPVEQFHYSEISTNDVNPALYHFVMPPWYLLFPFAFYFISVPLFGYFDGRFALLFLLVLLCISLKRWFKNSALGNIAITVIALSPATVDYFIEGRSDVFALSWLVMALFLLDKKNILLSSVMFALALLSKQTIWFATPFFLSYLWVMSKRKMKGILKPILVITFVVVLIAGPFFMWDPKAFIDSVVVYLTGGSATGYPVSGYGLSMVLYEFGFIKDRLAYYPFIVWQALFGIPIFIAMIVWFIKSPKMSRFFIAYGISLTVIWYTSRYFNNSHLAYLTSIFALGILKDIDEKEA